MGIGKITEFNVRSGNWTSYVERVEMYFKVNSIQAELWLPTLIAAMGDEAYELLSNLTSPMKPSEKSFTAVVQLMKDHLQPKPSFMAERYRFRQRRQQAGESISQYISELKRLARYCEFNTVLEENLRDQLVCGLSSETIRQRVFAEDNLQYANAVKIACAMEAAERDAAAVDRNGAETTSNKSASTEVLHAGVARRGRSASWGASGARYAKKPGQRGGGGGGGGGAGGSSCSVCGAGDHRSEGCRYKTYICGKCRQRGHLRRVCPSRVERSDNMVAHVQAGDRETSPGNGPVLSEDDESSYSDVEEEDLHQLCLNGYKPMPQTVPRSGFSPPSASQGERAVPGSPADLQHLLRLLGAASPPESMLHSPPNPHSKPPPPYPEDNNFLDPIYDFEGYPTPSPSSDEGSIPTVAYQPPSPYKSLQFHSPVIKEEPNRLSVPGFASPYPLSPSGSCVSYSSNYTQYSYSPVPSHEEYIDIEELLKENQILQESVQQNHLTPKIEVEEPRDHVLLRSALEDTSFQKRLNLKPIPFELGPVKMEESSGGDDALVTPDIDRVLSMAIEQSRRDVDNTCTVLGISPDPMLWRQDDVKAWVTFTLRHFNLQMVPEEYFAMDGPALAALTEEEFIQRAPQSGSTLYAQLEIWKAARHETWRTSTSWSEHQQPPTTPTPVVLPSTEDVSDDDDSEPAIAAPTGGGKVKTGSTHIHLWQFLKELLASPQIHGSAIRWLDRNNGVFKIEDSVRVARLWGKRKNRPAMNYDKLSRSIRQYYKKGIMKKTERSQRLVYQFCHPYCL